jgi:hypothetical protein
VRSVSIMPRINYSTALRCIGQDLEIRGLKTFDIRADGDEYEVLAAYQEPPAPTPVAIRYSLADITDLDTCGEEHRGETLPAKEFLNFVQVLRTIGGYLDKNEARLIRISNNEAPVKDSTLRVEYETRDGERVIDDRAGTAIYDLCVMMYKQRGRGRARYAGRRR